MKKNLLVAQSGAPSAAINATLCGVVEQGLADENIEKVYGVKNGKENFKIWNWNNCYSDFINTCFNI